MRQLTAERCPEPDRRESAPLRTLQCSSAQVVLLGDASSGTANQSWSCQLDELHPELVQLPHRRLCMPLHGLHLDKPQFVS